MHNCLAPSYVPRHLPLQASPHVRLLAWRLDFCSHLLGMWGLCNSRGLAVPTMSSASWLSTAPSVLCLATCIIHEGGLLSPRACCSFARIMDFDRTPCRAGLLVISVVIAIPFLLTYPRWPPSAAQRRCPCPRTQRQAGPLPLLPRSPRHSPPWGLLSLSPCVSPFPVLWLLSPVPLKKWIAILLIFRPLLWRARGWREQVFKHLCCLSPA